MVLSKALFFSERPNLCIAIYNFRRITVIRGEKANIPLSIDTNADTINKVVIYKELEITTLHYDCNEVRLIVTSVEC